MNGDKVEYVETERSFRTSVLDAVFEELAQALEPMVPYKRDPLEFANAAHDVKNEHIRNALRMLQK